MACVHGGQSQTLKDREEGGGDKSCLSLSLANINRTLLDAFLVVLVLLLSSLQQRNFKQKIVALLKRFKVPEEIGEESRHAGGRLRPGHTQLDELFQELDELSCGDGEDSGPDVDSLSIGSTPKPSLRPFFANSRNTMHEHIKGDDKGWGEVYGKGWRH